MNNINLFELSSTFEAASGGGTLAYPNTSLITETNQLYLLLPEPELYEWVDLGLPSGLKWAAWNVGATKPEEYGLYFQWGETEGYTADDVNNDVKEFSWSDYKLCDGSSSTLNKYNNDSSKGTVDTLTTLEQVDDAAYTSDNTCRMPTKDEWQELIDNTKLVYTNVNNVSGWQFTSKQDISKSIFIPIAGRAYDGSIHSKSSRGYIWSSSLKLNGAAFAHMMILYSDYVNISNDLRSYGCSVRPVKD